MGCRFKDRLLSSALIAASQIIMMSLLQKTWLSLVLGAGLSFGAGACTLFGAAGDGVVAGDGVLVAKTRDWRPDLQKVAVKNPRTGFSYLGLFTGKAQHFNMGINEKGLVLARSSSEGIPKEKRLEMPRFRKDGLTATDYIMQHFASVDDVLAHPEVFVEPVNYILADRTKVAVVEVLPGGKTTVRVQTRGTIAHTNHFIEPESAALNEKVGTSSATRLARINELLESGKKPFTLADFIAMTKDRHDGPVNSIWRVGKRTDGPQTLGAMAVFLPPQGAPKIYLTWRTEKFDPQSMQTVERTLAPQVFHEATAEFLANK